MGTFLDAYAEWRNRPFPPGSTDDLLDELHADLALTDTWVAESVVPYVERRVYQPAKADVIGTLGSLCRRAVELGVGRRIEDAQVTESYRDYAELLMRVYQGFLEAQGRS